MMRLHDELQRLKREVEYDKLIWRERFTKWEMMPAGVDKDCEEYQLRHFVHLHRYRLSRINEIESELRVYAEHVDEQSTSILLCDKVWNRRTNR